MVFSVLDLLCFFLFMILPYSTIAETSINISSGFNSLCGLGDEEPICQCPTGYNPIDPNDALRGCKQNFVPQSCDQASPETDLFDFQEMPNTNFLGGDYEHFKDVDKDWCKQNCLNDCFCAVAIVNPARDCFKKGLPFPNGTTNSSYESTALIKFGKDNSTLRTCGGANIKKTALIGSGVLNILLPLITYLVVSVMEL